ncbi:DNA-directed DNA polymerase delta [Apiospora arundinis]
MRALVRTLIFTLVFACAPAYFAWITNNDIKSYFVEHGMGHDAAHTRIVLAACIMHVVFPIVRVLLQFLQLTEPPGMTRHTYKRVSGTLALVALVFDCFVAKYSWEWRQIFVHAGETVLAKNCLALFIIIIFGLALEGILLGAAIIFVLGICGLGVTSSAISTV